jgi:uncharacterized protein
MVNRHSNLLIIFVKTPVKGRVKTRLARTIGDENALNVYRRLIDHTCFVAGKAEADTEIWCSDPGGAQFEWGVPGAEVKVQILGSLGEKMNYSFKEAFDNGYKRVVIIGSDCYEITSGHINDAFQYLEKSDVVIGPSVDGGYYLLGMNSWYPNLFKNISWSTTVVYQQTLLRVSEEEYSILLLETLNDIDTIEDLRKSQINPESV